MFNIPSNVTLREQRLEYQTVTELQKLIWRKAVQT